MATLYELTGKYLDLLNMAEDVDPTVFHDTLDAIQDTIEVKADGYAKVDKEFAKDEVALREEAQRLSARASSIGNKRRLLKQNLQDSMEATDTPKIKTDKFTIYIQNNPAKLNIEDESQIPAYLTVTKHVIDNAKIKQLLKEGKEVPGAELTVGRSLRIK